MEPEAPATAAQLREFVLHIDLKLEQLRTEMTTAIATLRTEMVTEFGRIHARLERIETRMDDHDRRLSRIERRLDDLALPPVVGSLVTTLLLGIIAVTVLYGVFR